MNLSVFFLEIKLKKCQVLLSVAAVVSLALGIFQDLQPGRDPNKPRVDWVEGVAVVVAIIIVVCV
jgi:P-type Ca2+ transporter type 2C